MTMFNMKKKAILVLAGLAMVSGTVLGAGNSAATDNGTTALTGSDKDLAAIVNYATQEAVKAGSPYVNRGIPKRVLRRCSRMKVIPCIKNKPYG